MAELVSSQDSWWASLPKTPTGTPAPPVPHATIAKELQAKPNLLIIGDIHGCIDELRGLLEQVKFDPASWALVSVGDIVAKGPDSAACVRLLKQLGAVGVRGNHEDNVLEAALKLRESGEHVALAAALDPAELRWLAELPLTLQLPHVGADGVRIVHAGLLPGVGLAEQRFVDMLWMRDVKEGVGLKKPVDGSEAWARLWQGREHVVFGHDAQRFVQCHDFATGLDSGCCYGNQLTAIRVAVTADAKASWDRREMVSVKAARMYSVPTRRGAHVGESPCPKQLQTPGRALEATPEKEPPPREAQEQTPAKPPWLGPDVVTPKRAFSSLVTFPPAMQERPEAKRACQVTAS